jgi:hypothetical protein
MGEESLKPITLGNGAGEVGVLQALEEIVDRTGWTVVVDGRAALEKATVPADHLSLEVCLRQIAEAVGLECKLGCAPQLALLRLPFTGASLEYDRVCGYIEGGTEAIHRSEPVLEVMQSLTPTQRTRLTQPPYSLAWADLTPDQQTQIVHLFGSPWAKEGFSLEEIVDGLTILAGARAVVYWKIGGHDLEVTLRATPGCPIPVGRELRPGQRPPRPITLPWREEPVYTLGEIVQAVADQTDRELYAEPEVGELTVRFFTAKEALPDEALLRLGREMAGAMWQRVGEVELLCRPDLSQMLAIAHAEEKRFLLLDSFNAWFLAELPTWLPVANLPLPADPRTRMLQGHRLGDLEAALQEELIQALRRDVSDMMREVIGAQFLRADWLADSRVRFEAQLLFGFAHEQHGRRFYASRLLP